tara:strand:- start:1180 stop:1458 length:279 start_codon:yes stop_codon:yes gene_type:complete
LARRRISQAVAALHLLGLARAHAAVERIDRRDGLEALDRARADEVLLATACRDERVEAAGAGAVRVERLKGKRRADGVRAVVTPELRRNGGR